MQPLPILPQYWPPAGVQLTDGMQATSLPASVPPPVVPAVPVVAVVPAAPVAPDAPVAPPVPEPP